MRIFFVLLALSFFIPSSQAQESFGKGAPIQAKPRVRKEVNARLTAAQIERVKAFKQLTRGVDVKSLDQTIEDIETADRPEIELQKQEAVAKTYADVAAGQKIVEPKEKEWLLSMVSMNLAYLQFGAEQDDSGNALNRMIRKKLREYLGPDVLNDPEFVRKLE